MQISIISFTGRGQRLSKKIGERLSEEECFLYTKTKIPETCKTEDKESAGDVSISAVREDLATWTSEQMACGRTLIFIGACGIAVRSIAPFLTDKLHDAPVLVTDEQGRYVIPILSGHYGGANELAIRVAKAIGAQPVITTATDLNGTFAVDLFAKKNGLVIAPKEGIAKISAKLLAGGTITMAVDGGVNGEIPSQICLAEKKRTKTGPAWTGENNRSDEDEKGGVNRETSDNQTDVYVGVRRIPPESAALQLIPKSIVLGIGCKKGKNKAEIEAFVLERLAAIGVCMEAVGAVASIDVKREEPGLLAFAEAYGLSFLCYSAEELGAAKGDFETSDFVKRQVGVDNVCERAAALASGGGVFLLQKYARDGMTLAVAEREWSVDFEKA